MATKKQARELGFDTGYDIARQNAADFFDKYEEDSGGQIKYEDLKGLLGYIASEAASTESETFRQFSPFEFTAKEFNDSRDPDGMWEAYEDGVYKGALKAAKEFVAESCVTVIVRND